MNIEILGSAISAAKDKNYNYCHDPSIRVIRIITYSILFIYVSSIIVLP